MKWASLFSLENQVAVIVGAAGGLGQEIVKILADAGARVSLADIDRERLQNLKNQIDSSSQKAIATVCDTTQKSDLENLISLTEQKFGTIDILVNCAGILGGDKTMFEISEKDWDELFCINLKGTWLAATEVSRYMIDHAVKGKIINISSSLGYRSQLKRTAYASSKAGVEHLTRNMAMELIPYGIRVNCLAPGWMNTAMVNDILSGPQGAKWREAIPMKRPAEPEELTGALLLLASDASSYMTGTVIRVDGGYSYCGIELHE